MILELKHIGTSEPYFASRTWIVCAGKPCSQGVPGLWSSRQCTGEASALWRRSSSSPTRWPWQLCPWRLQGHGQTTPGPSALAPVDIHRAGLNQQPTAEESTDAAMLVSMCLTYGIWCEARMRLDARVHEKT